VVWFSRGLARSFEQCHGSQFRRSRTHRNRLSLTRNHDVDLARERRDRSSPAQIAQETLQP
jgi:hypothetical protein